MGIVAGEASGDLLGAELIQALRKQWPDLQVTGLGGPAMIAAGCNSLFDIERLSVMGLVEPLLHLPDLFKLRRALYSHFSQQLPDLFIGIDAPDFNLGLEQQLRQLGIPVVHYVSPSVWAWRRRRVHKIAKAVNLMLTLFPFEVKFYQQQGIPAYCVGHPLARQIPLHPDQRAARQALGLDEKAVYVALLPGSRKQELQRLAEPFLLAAKQIASERPQVKFLTSQINAQRSAAFYASYQQYAAQLPLTFFTGRTHDVLAAADVVLVASGTATLETMLFKKPMVIAYRLSPLTYLLATWLVKIPHVGLPNILAGELVVPELIQSAANPSNIAKHIGDYLDHPEKVRALEERFLQLHEQLRANTPDKVVELVGQLVWK
ncbi:MAG TPA: lipid-A-disaccharide synthase [Gammaproteobacteria bacterium]|jgi:lipid-A-disaccharide synthase|nr:lipid-A-disaccharide synthase [Gammaproteobacteria bacterium]